MKIILTLLIVLTIALSGKDIDFDALAKSEPQSGSVSLSFKDAAKVNEKNIMKLQRKQIKPIYDGLKAISDYSRTSPAYKYCGSYDTCHQVIESISSRKVKIKCIRGSNTGRTRVMCANSNGKWATGCGFSDVAAHHYKSVSAAAKNWCD